jgi:uncharacterized protein YjbI with pentapeptide repeats
LTEADLEGAKLEDAVLTGADLSRARLVGAKVTEKQLQSCASIKGATMPDGSIVPGGETKV